MITDKDRAYYIGASDTAYVMRSWETKTFWNWWQEKLGNWENTFQNEATRAGTAYEHRILDALRIPGLELDKQIIQGRLRVNYDGTTKEKVYEVKTHKAENPFKVSREYWMQVQVEMYALGVQEGEIIAYGLVPAEYRDHYRRIDPKRVTRHPIKYDHRFLQEYLERMGYLSDCLDKEEFPSERNFKKWRKQAHKQSTGKK